MQKKFLEHFPPPKYLDPPYTAVVFSDNAIRMLVLDKKNNHPVFFSETPLPAGIIEMGKIKNEEALSNILVEKRVELKTPFVKFSIPDETSYIFTAKVPVTEGNAKESVGFILEENVPLPLPDISFDFGVQKIDQVEAGFTADVAVIAVSTTLISSYVNCLEKAGLEPISCVNESEATAYAVVPRDSDMVSAIVHVHRESVGIYIVSNRFVEFSGITPLSPSDSIELRAESVKQEFLKAVEYWSGRVKKGESAVDFLPCYLCGEYEIMKRLSEFLAGPNVRVSLANVWVNLFSLNEFIPPISFEESLRVASGVGLFLDN